MKPERTPRSVTELIIRCCDLEAVLLSESSVRGQENRDSDLDILVIGDFRESPYLRGHEVRELLRRYAIHIDLHLVTPEEVASASGQPHGFLSSVLASCETLHEKAKRGET
jgi:uncharacterized protein